MKSAHRLKSIWLSVGLLLGLAYASCAQSSPWIVAGITNFDRVHSGLYRGAQPNEVGIESLQRLGVKTIIDLRLGSEVWAGEAIKARASGILYTNIPMSGVERPTGEQVAAVISIIESFPAPVFIHCRHGADRTGTIIACYRIKHDKWTSQAALLEAKQHAMYQGELGMMRFIEDYEKGWIAR